MRQQIEQTKGWSDSSQQTPDAKEYSFPWHFVKGNILVQGHEPVPMKFELDRGRLLDLLVGHTIYNDATVAVRELLQNAIDAVRYQHYLEEKEHTNTGRPASPMGRVIVKWNPSERVLVVEDNGIGMDRAVITSHLMKVGASFYNTPQFQHEFKDYTPISRFGIGILTNFMISDDIEIVTCKKNSGYRIKLTSVQSEYLLKKIESGDPLIRGIEPHGTRVTIKLRSTADPKERSMIDIVRYWIILPECEVLFQESGKEQELIGITTAADALKYFHKETTEEKEYLSGIYSYEIRSATQATEKGTYDFAFKVRKGFTPEWQIAQTKNTDAPVVCIEGIRADNVLPGFSGYPRYDEFFSRVIRKQDGQLCTLLSVRGNKDFRTTVSRTSLEKDDEYFRVGKICTDFFLEHLSKETERISKTSGFPLSRASSAAQWIYRSIYRTIEDGVESYLTEKYGDIPVIVVERIETKTDSIKTRRELISSNELQRVDEFWTIESRLVDYLGTISRDLGKELSLNEFLGTLAPELRDSRISTLIPDAAQFQDVILSSHVVKSIEFSRSNQQTLVNWILMKDKRPQLNSKDFENEVTNNEVFLGKLGTMFERLAPSRELFQWALSDAWRGISEILVAPIKGDIGDIYGINTRLATVLDIRSQIALVWNELYRKVVEWPADKPKTDEYYWVLLGIASLASGCMDNSILNQAFGARDRFGASTLRDLLWKEASQQIRKSNIIQTMNVQQLLNQDLLELMGKDENWFDASKYWWDWFKGSFGRVNY